MADTGVVAGFKVMLIVMAFYSVSITLITYSLQDVPAALTYLGDYQTISDDYDMETFNDEVIEGFNSQQNIPVLEFGSLVFYSGNILVDLLGNFFYALPQMLGLIINGITILFNLDPYIFVVVQAFAGVLMSVLWVFGLIQLLTGIRSGRII